MRPWDAVGIGACLLASVVGGLIVVPVILRLAARGVAVGTMSREAVSTLRGGLWIGVLERLALTGSIAFGFSLGVGVVVAIKGLGRYPELRDHPAASERFVVGTLASFVWACGWGLVARAIG